MYKLRLSTKRISLLTFSLTATALLIAPSIAMATTGTTSSSAPTTSYLSQFGSHGTGPGEFNGPYDVAIAGNGNMYVVDPYNNRIEIFTSNGTYISQFGSTGNGNGELSGPAGLAIASNGNVYVADNNNNRIEVFASDGTYLSQFGSHGTGNGQFTNPYDIAIASNGNMYVADFNNRRIQEFTSGGTYVTQFGSYGTGDGEFNAPSDVAIASSGNVYVADPYNNRIEIFTSNGTYISQFGSTGSGNGELNIPFNLDVASNGNVYVAEAGNSRIQEFTSIGTYVRQFGSQGTGNGQFMFPYGVTVTNNGTIYVADVNNYRVDVFGFQQNLGTVISATGSSQISLTLPDTDNISSLNSSIASTTDGNYNYPLGLIDFTSSVASGSTTFVTLTFQTELKSGDVTTRKYNPTTKQYATVPGATITETTAGGKPALQLTYSVTDGGALDQDGTANGTIVDPVGLATVAGPGVTAPDTGYAASNQSSSIIIDLAAGAIVLIGVGAALLYRSKRATDRK